MQVSAKVLARMEEGGNPAERAMAAKYAKGIKADQVGVVCMMLCRANNDRGSASGHRLGPCLLTIIIRSAGRRWQSCFASARGLLYIRRCSTGSANSSRQLRW